MKTRYSLRSMLACALFVVFSSFAFAQTPAEDFNVLTTNARRLLPDALNKIALGFLNEREQRIARITTRAEITERQRYIRERFLQAIGGLPERTPLNPRVTGTLKRDGYRIEKVIFESLPKFYVTANLYVPETGRAPYPAILMPLGHEEGGKAHEAWQRLAITFAKNGFVMLLFEPVGQGERVQLYDPDFGESKVIRSTDEHTLVGTQCLLLGHSFARHTIWDAMRALDYLVSRPEVDTTRIGCTGNSGGGTMTAYLSALDDRIQVAAPSCYLTNWRNLLETIGPQDAEQNLPPWLADGLDQPDFVLAFAPKPMLMLSAIRDFFPIAGARQTFREGKRLYSLLGAEEKFQMVEADDGHGYTLPRRLAAYRWMNRWLKGVDAPIAEPEIEIESEADLHCTEAGQVTMALGGETIFSLNRVEAERVKPKRGVLNSAADLQRLQQEIRTHAQRLTAYTKPSGKPVVRGFGTIARDGYQIEKLVITNEPSVTVPALLFVPGGAASKRRAVLYVHDNGKAAEAKAGAEIESLVRGGMIVLAIDLRGLGETREEADRIWNPFGTFDSAMTALLSGKTLVGLRAQDVVSVVDVLVARNDVEGESLLVYGKGAAAVAVLHAAAADERIKRVTLEEMLVSYDAVSVWKIHQQIFSDIVPGALAAYDLPDLAMTLAPRSLTILNAVNPRRKLMVLTDVKAQYQNIQKAFALAGASQSLVIAERKPGQKLSKWLL
ncbi:MAG TPA: acetylxylan esterase [Blastocatellia bacterium]|nr:acetylxylan esterase [Blastocatellia bacterium]